MCINTVDILAPRLLGQTMAGTEDFYSRVVAAPESNQYRFNMKLVSLVKPFGAIALIMAARFLTKQSRTPVTLYNLKENVQLYLDRMDVFNHQYSWLIPSEVLSEEWYRNPQTPNLLELTLINGKKDVEIIVSRAKQVFDKWLSTVELGNLLTILSEICANIYQHSGDRYGCVLIQKYEIPSRGIQAVSLSVGDMGCGIQASIVNRHGLIKSKPVDYLIEAIQGRTSRASGRGGFGLRTVRSIASSTNGYLWLRSDTSLIEVGSDNLLQSRSELAHIPGTQLAIELQAPI